MENYICQTSGVQYGESKDHPLQCTICEEERQYVNKEGQQWTTLNELANSKSYKNVMKDEEEGLFSIKTEPGFGIGQNAYIVQDGSFNLLWDCITYLDEHTINNINSMGGLHAIALSHPHYYSTQVEWAENFNCTIYIHEDDKDWVTRKSDRIKFWSGESLELTERIILQRIGGHYKGATILEWRKQSNNHGVLLTGDIIRVVADRNWVSLMYSYPNLIPLPTATVERINQKLEKLQFASLYDAFNRVIRNDAKLKVDFSIKRYLAALNGTLFDT
ncbi:MBL fold metallo-hydrolase [Terribacillus saccharophilus]|uniref:hypothetical protein n=1 Tax=Terribacillus saccharophilus TaxID=361277 RepID=UPI000C9CD004|nr:hypothetical protein [Terribacillus goriensis]